MFESEMLVILMKLLYPFCHLYKCTAKINIVYFFFFFLQVNVCK